MDDDEIQHQNQTDDSENEMPESEEAEDQLEPEIEEIKIKKVRGRSHMKSVIKDRNCGIVHEVLYNEFG